MIAPGEPRRNTQNSDKSFSANAALYDADALFISFLLNPLKVILEIHPFLIPWCRNSQFPALQGCQSVRLATEKCHWGFETFPPIPTSLRVCVCVCVCVSRWSAKARWAAVGPALPARRTSLCSMSTLAEPVSSARGPRMTSLVSALHSCVCNFTRFAHRPEERFNLGHATPNPLTSHVANTHTHTTNSRNSLLHTNTHVLYTRRETLDRCQKTGFGWRQIYVLQSLYEKK